MTQFYQSYDKLSDDQKKNIIQKMYVQNRLSFADIANEYSTYANKIRRDAKKFNVSIRDKSEAQKNALITGKHKHPTKGKQREDRVKEKIGDSVMKSWDRLSENKLNERKKISKKNWDNLDKNKQANILKKANDAVRVASKKGSKLENYLLSKLINDGYRVDFHKEQSLVNTKLQIDLFLPTINMAIEIDGPSHFSPVWGDESLKRNQKYDSKKEGLILGKGWHLIRIKQNKDFSKARANVIYGKLLDTIKNLDNKKILTKTIEDI